MDETINIDGVTYVKQPSDGAARHIVMVDNRGLTFVGFVDFSNAEYPKTIHGARCVIQWGTNEHLAELATKGPLKNTKLGYIGDFTMHSSPIGSYRCSDAWYE